MRASCVLGGCGWAGRGYGYEVPVYLVGGAAIHLITYRFPGQLDGFLAIGGRRAMVKFFFAILLLLIFVGAGFGQQGAHAGATPGQAQAHTNPCDTATTQVEMNECSAAEYKKADARLNTVYKNLVRLLQKDAGGSAQQSGGEQKKPEAPAVQKLKAAQREWMRYRDLHCDAVKAQYAGGSISPLEWSTCMTGITNDRVAELKRGYETGDRKLE
ncbi:MAG: lysozyme inhibitor LprI family protein [Candidatus Acidiferrales bacterium]